MSDGRRDLRDTERMVLLSSLPSTQVNNIISGSGVRLSEARALGPHSLRAKERQRGGARPA